MMSLKESIGWTDRTCNPIKGMCKGGCWYCYTKIFYEMNRLKPEIRLDLTAFDALPKKKHKKIFLCSTHELFGKWIPKEWRDAIFQEIEKRSHLTFQILTKLPENIDRPMPDNVWTGTTITSDKDYFNNEKLLFVKAKKRFISFEPFLYDESYTIPPLQYFDWIIIGALTGRGSDKYKPNLNTVGNFVKRAKKYHVPIFMKDNLRSVWGSELIQEMPE